MEYASSFKTRNASQFFSALAYYVYMQHLIISFGATCICRLGQNVQQVFGVETIFRCAHGRYSSWDWTHAQSAVVIYLDGVKTWFQHLFLISCQQTQTKNKALLILTLYKPD
jgi:hypothetical protein